MPSVVFHGEESTLVALRAVSEGYPLRGRLKIADRPFGPGRATDGIPGPGEAWADSRLLARLGAAVGTRLAVGAHEVVVTRVLDYRPDQGAGFGDLSATLLINIDDVPATQLIQPGSRVNRALLFAADPGPVTDSREYLDAPRRKGERLQSVADASPQIRASSDRAGRFLSLASLVSVLLSAIAVAMAARRYASRHLDNVALMKCMGASQGFVLQQTIVAHQDYSQICPIFKEGVENELTIRFPCSASISSCIDQKMGREVVVMEAFFRYLTISLSTNQSCSLAIWKNTLSTQIGSIDINESLFLSVSAEVHGFWTSASLTSTSFTSTDCVMVSTIGKSASTAPAEVVIRYRDK